MKELLVSNMSNTSSPVIKAGYCDSFLCRLRGLMLKKSLPKDGGLLLVQDKESRLDAAIHMFAMLIDLTIIWINQDCQVVDVRRAFRWRSILIPKTPAKYVLEVSLEHYDHFQTGDTLNFEEII